MARVHDVAKDSPAQCLAENELADSSRFRKRKSAVAPFGETTLKLGPAMRTISAAVCSAAKCRGAIPPQTCSRYIVNYRVDEHVSN